MKKDTESGKMLEAAVIGLLIGFAAYFIAGLLQFDTYGKPFMILGACVIGLVVFFAKLKS